MPQTTDHLWQMILEQNVTMIISTCKTKEGGRAKCNQFWPQNVGDELKFETSQTEVNSTTVKLIERKELS